ncbi:MAG: DUF547 domain-containing protein [Pseudomonadota bacterium]
MRLWILALTVLMLAGCARFERIFVPDARLVDERWLRKAEPPGQQIDHAAWDAFLARYLTTDAAGVNRLAYGAVTAADREQLEHYLQDLQRVAPADLTRDQQLAYWINLYNAATVRLVLDAYPVDSIRRLGDGPLTFGPWDRKVVVVDGVALGLNEIEHDIVRPVFDEPAVHMALNCAAVGCPNLQATAWRAHGIDRRLAAAERAYVNDPRGVRVHADGRLILSKIYIWFQEDFGTDQRAVLRHVASFAEPPLREEIERRTHVDGYAYDWSLNDADVRR